MSRFPGAPRGRDNPIDSRSSRRDRGRMDPLIIVGEQAMTPDEYARHQRRLEWKRNYHRVRWATDPVYRERMLAHHREWKERNRARVREYNREWMRRYRERRRAA